MTCFRCGDDQNLIRDDAADTGAVCAWCLQHPEGFNEADDDLGAAFPEAAFRPR
jgi:hypothetical protein